MPSTRIKICGITRPDDARAATDCGADAIGLVFFADSPRTVSVDQALQIAAVVPPLVNIVALFVDEPAASIERILIEVPISLIQFHGAESADFCQQFARPWIKSVRVRAGFDLAQACRDYPSARGILVDSWQEGVPGGTGKTFDWNLAQGEQLLPVILAGGLHAGNVGEAIRALRPAAVDLSSGVECAPGVKDAAKIQQFIAAVRAADQELDGVTNGK
jgi:phosphoribosylanthranilate isomerase